MPEEEMATLTQFDQQTIELRVPRLDEQRHLIVLKKK